MGHPSRALALALGSAGAVIAVLACGGDPAGAPDAPSGPPAVQLIGRFETEATGAEGQERATTAWPGGRIVVRFDGAAVTMRLSQIPPLHGDVSESWFNVVVDGAFRRKVSVSAEREEIAVAEGLAPGVHVVELEKRTEANRGAVRLEEVVFPGGGKLLAPPVRKERRIEFVGDSTIDGFGADGDATSCKGGTPPELDDVRKSVAHFVATTLDAESHLIAYSGKGVVTNESGDAGEKFPDVYPRTLPDDPASTWRFDRWIPDVVVIALGGTDVARGKAPAGFREGYAALVDSIRKRYPSAHVFMTVWSQIKDLPDGRARSSLRAELDAIRAAHPEDTKLHVFAWREADYPRDETGCAEHANEAHGKETAAEIVPAIRAATGWR